MIAKMPHSTSGSEADFHYCTVRYFTINLDFSPQCCQFGLGQASQAKKMEKQDK
jgi:hypothetical protein